MCCLTTADVRAIINAAAESLKTPPPWQAMDLARHLDDVNSDGVCYVETNVEIYVHQNEPEEDEDMAANANSEVKENRQLSNNELNYRHQQGSSREAEEGRGVLHIELKHENRRQEQQMRQQQQLDFKLKHAGFPTRNCSPNILRLKDGMHKVIPTEPTQSAVSLTPLLQATLYHAPPVPPPLRPTTASHQAGAEADAESEDAAQDVQQLPVSESAHQAMQLLPAGDHEPRHITSAILDAKTNGTNNTITYGTHSDQHNEDDVPRCLAASGELDQEWRKSHCDIDPRIPTTPDCIMMNIEADVLCLQPSIINPSFTSTDPAANVVQVPAQSVVKDSVTTVCDSVAVPEVLQQGIDVELAAISDRCIRHDRNHSVQHQHVQTAQLFVRQLAASGYPVLPPALPCFMDSKRREVNINIAKIVM